MYRGAKGKLMLKLWKHIRGSINRTWCRFRSKRFASAACAVAMTTILATFSGPTWSANCAPFLNLANDIVTSQSVHSACGEISVGPNYFVLDTGKLFLQTTSNIVFESGFSVFKGGSLRAGPPPSANFSTFSSTGGAIPDSNPAGLNLTFNVVGMSDNINRVQVAIKMSHTAVGQLTATLTSPQGMSKLVLFGRPGYRPGSASGVNADFDGVYTFDDFALESLWDEVSGLGPASTVSSGTYRTSTAAPFRGATLLSNAGGCSTYLSGAFNGLSPADANGTWTLQFVDAQKFETGSVTNVDLRLGQGATSKNLISGFILPGQCTPARYDFTGTGRQSYAYTKPDSGFLRWHIKGNDGSVAGQPEETFIIGSDIDNPLPDDYDGDGIWDAAVWQPDPDNAPDGRRLVIRRSSRPSSDLLIFPLGVNGDLYKINGDYDGDRVADPSVMRIPDPFPNLDIRFLSLLSTDGGEKERELIPAQTDETYDSVIFPGEDLTGDGVDDFALVLSDSWTVYDGPSGLVFSNFVFGPLSGAFIIPGDFVGSERGDFTRVFVDSGDIVWQTRDGETGVVGPEFINGALVAGTSEFAASGDYDGDGKQDYAVWRRNNTGGPGTAEFIVLQSSDLTILSFFFGESTGTPVAVSQQNN